MMLPSWPQDLQDDGLAAMSNGRHRASGPCLRRSQNLDLIRVPRVLEGPGRQHKGRSQNHRRHNQDSGHGSLSNQPLPLRPINRRGRPRKRQNGPQQHGSHCLSQAHLGPPSSNARTGFLSVKDAANRALLPSPQGHEERSAPPTSNTEAAKPLGPQAGKTDDPLTRLC